MPTISQPQTRSSHQILFGPSVDAIYIYVCSGHNSTRSTLPQAYISGTYPLVKVIRSTHIPRNSLFNDLVLVQVYFSIISTQRYATTTTRSTQHTPKAAPWRFFVLENTHSCLGNDAMTQTKAGTHFSCELY